ncbi:MAG: ABC transporter ATP-binding protein [Caldilineaceae bacterium]|nr:ABC transporter ATP-binding protein [Caldilineaceae bacterium]
MGAIRAGLTAEAYDREYSNRQLLGRIGSYFRPYWRRLALITVMVSLMSVIGALLPILVARGVEALDTGGANTDRLTSILIGAVLFLGVANWAVNWVRRLNTSMLLGDVVFDMRTDAFAAVMNHDMNFFDRFQSGRIVSRITSDTDEFSRVAILLTEIITQFTLVGILLVYLWRINPRLTLLLAALAPVAFIVATSFQRVARRITRRSQRAIAEVNVSIQEAVTGISIAKNFRREEGIYEEFLDVNRQSYDVHVKRGMVLAMLFPTLTFFSSLGTAILLYYGGMSAYWGIITAGAWFLFMNSVGQFWFPMINLSAFWSQFQSALSATERTFSLIDAEPVIYQTGDRPVPSLAGDIRFCNVDFRYSEKEQVLGDFNLHIRPGERVALVGHTGAGKSSIAKLVTRFYEFQAGELLIDDMDIRTLNLHDYRRRLGIVSQSPFLFAGTIADNIRYATPEMSDEEVAAVARQIGHGDWIDALYDGLQTDVGERGARLSMGQRQLVVLARMLAQNPAIFILDEATASIDPFTESQIQEALDRILENRTSIIIAHRLSTVKAVDRILVLEQGRIIEEGSHNDLMARGGHYADLYNVYFRHQSLDFINERRQSATN